MLATGKDVGTYLPDGEGGYGFIRLSMEPITLALNRDDYAQMAARLTMIQDQAQVDVYEDKSEQFRRWGHWMPDTWRFTDKFEAMEFLERAQFPIVSKADQGASSVHVHIHDTKRSAQKHVELAFGHGIPLVRSQRQHGYVLFQRCIPHKITHRVNVVGRCRAIFLRHCYADRMVAQTGNVEPALTMTEELESLIEYSDRVVEDIGTKWCALDILKDGEQWRLLETSEGWPWPSYQQCDLNPILRSKNRLWSEMWEVLLDEIEEGVWS